MGTNLRVGDLVLWRGGFGNDLQLSARVERINLTSDADPKGESAPSLEEVSWALVSGSNPRAVVVSLDNSHWAYGYQILPVRS